MGKIVDSVVKYRPRSFDEFVFPNKYVEEVVRAYGSGEITRPLILSGTNGVGKSLLAEIIPYEIEGFKPQINRVRSCDLNSNVEVYSQFGRNKQFDSLFTINNQRFNYNVIEEVNMDSKARDAFRVVLDEYRGLDMTIITTNEVGKIDIGIRSRCEILEIPPCEPSVFFCRAKAIIEAEGFNVDDEGALMAALEAIYDARADNRRYYQVIDDILRSL